MEERRKGGKGGEEGIFKIAEVSFLYTISPPISIQKLDWGYGHHFVEELIANILGFSEEKG